jgi:tRNA threonylcarbamoyladenosine biosynthesis protein TsaE
MTTLTAAATRTCGEALAQFVRAGDVVLLSGDLGAGKTQLTKGLGVGLGVTEPVTSPTFNIMLIHQGRIPLYHFDLYRLEHAHQLEDLDYWATLEADGVSVVEWGDRFSEALPADGIDVRITIEGDDVRAIEVIVLGERGRDLAARWLESCTGLEDIEVGP